MSQIKTEQHDTHCTYGMAETEPPDKNGNNYSENDDDKEAAPFFLQAHQKMVLHYSAF